jgi:WD40 repeat protein
MFKKFIILSLFLLALAEQRQTFVFAQSGDTCGAQLPSRLQIGEQGRVLPGPANNLRSEPTSSSQDLGEIPGEEVFDVLEGPVCADNIVWWQVQYNGIIGWTGEGINSEYWVESLAPVVPAEPTPEDNADESFCEGALPPQLNVGSMGVVNPGDANNLRVDPSSEAALIAQIPAGHTFQLLKEPVCTDGGIWWQVNYEGMIGWTLEGGEEYYLSPAVGASSNDVESLTTCPNLPPSRVAIDQIIRVLPGDSNVIRNAPSTFAEQVGSAVSGAALRVLRGTQCEASVAWWQVEVLESDIVGWTAEILFDEYLLEPITPITADNADQVVELHSFGRGAIVDSLWWTQDGHSLIVPTPTGLWIYNVPNLNSEAQFLPHEALISKIAMSSDEQEIAIGTQDGEIFIYQLGNQISTNMVFSFPEDEVVILSLAYHESDPILQVVSNSVDGEATRYYDTSTFEEVEYTGEEFPAYGDALKTQQYAISPSGEHAAGGSIDSGLMIRRYSSERNMPMENREIINSQYSNLALIEGVAYSPDGFWLVSVARDGRIRLWDVVNAYEPYQSIESHIPPVTSVALSPTQDIAAIGTVDGVVRLWNPLTGEFIGEYRTENYENSVNDLDFSPDGAELAVAYSDSVRVWDIGLGAIKDGLGGTATQVGYSPDGRYLFAAYLDIAQLNNPAAQQNKLTVWAYPSYTDVTANLNLPADAAFGGFAFSLLGNHVALYPVYPDERSADFETYALETGSWQQMYSQPGFIDSDETRLFDDPASTVIDSAFTGLLATVSPDFGSDWYVELNTLNPYRRTREQLRSDLVLLIDYDFFTIGEHADGIVNVALHHNRNLLISGSQDGIVKSWGIPSPTE